MGVYYQTWGNHEQFSGGDISTNQKERQVRWFKIVNCYQIVVREQMRIAEDLTGDVDVGADKNNQDVLPLYIAKRKKESYSKFYKGKREHIKCDQNFDVSDIAFRFLDLWDGLELSNKTPKPDNIRQRCFSPANLEMIEKYFRLILACSNIIGRIDVEESELVTVS